MVHIYFEITGHAFHIFFSHQIGRLICFPTKNLQNVTPFYKRNNNDMIPSVAYFSLSAVLKNNIKMHLSARSTAKKAKPAQIPWAYFFHSLLSLSL